MTHAKASEADGVIDADLTPALPMALLQEEATPVAQPGSGFDAKWLVATIAVAIAFAAGAFLLVRELMHSSAL